MIIVVMGVSGCGKTTIGKVLSEELALPFLDADQYHPEANVEKMRRGIPLSDSDRTPWLNTLSDLLKQEEKNKGCVLACSALKEIYRNRLQKDLLNPIQWVHLHGSKEIILQRLQNRKTHYMPASLLDSQFETLEKPVYALSFSIESDPENIVKGILEKIKMQPTNEIGLVGLGVMGKSLAENFLDKGIKVSVYNRHVPGMEEGIAQAFASKNPKSTAFDNLSEFILSLNKPRKILLMIKAGGAIDEIIELLNPLLESGDIIMDGGNSHYEDTKKRCIALDKYGIIFMGVGISGGEEGARNGPSIMPGGTKEGYNTVAKILELIAAKDKNNKPCCSYIGPDGAGHFVKMVHNAIEYAEMQIIAEVYYLFKKMKYTNPQIAAIFKEWQKEQLGSFLLQISSEILLKKEGEEYLVDLILDAAEQKGTGGWSVKAAMDLGIVASTLTEAVNARIISSLKEKRLKAHDLYKDLLPDSILDIKADDIQKAYRSARIINHAIGFSMLHQASVQYKWNLNFPEIARIWTNGCIIRSELMEKLSLYLTATSDLLTQPDLSEELKSAVFSLKITVASGIQHGLALPVLSTALNYFLGLISADSPANLIQAQRDFFGAHTYRRKDKASIEYFHSNWKA